MYFKVFIFLVFSHTFLFGQNPTLIKLAFDSANIIGSYTVKTSKNKINSSLFISQIIYESIESKGIVEFEIYPEGFEKITIRYDLDTIKNPYFETLQLKEKFIELNEAVISSKRNRYSMRGDTINVFVEDIKTKPHADASTLFEKIEGFESNDNGTYKALGKNIDIVSIDGRRIFGGSPFLTLSNIKADMIKSIDIITRNGGISGSKTTINLKLKEDKKHGAYGNIGAGFGTSDTYEVNFKANRLLKKGIFSNFGQSNSINLFNLKPIIDNEMVEDFYAKNSIFGYQRMSLTYFNNLEEENLNNGIFKKSDVGTSFTIDNSKVSQSLNILIKSGSQFNNSATESITKSEEETILSKTISNNNVSNFSSLASYALKAQISRKLSLFFKSEYNYGNKNQLQNDEIRFETNNEQFERKVRLNAKNKSNSLKMDFGMALSNPKRKMKSLIFTNFSLNSNNNNVKVNNINPDVYQNSSNINGTVEFLQSYPLSKKILAEHRLSYNIISGQYNNEFNTKVSNVGNLNYTLLDNWFYYQNSQFILNTNLAAIQFPYFLSGTSSFQKKVFIKDISVTLPRSHILSKFNFKYQNIFTTPILQDKLAFPDSSNFYFRNIGNENINPYFKKVISIGYNNVNLSFANIIGSLSLNQTQNETQNDLILQEGILYLNTRKNVNRQLNSVTGNAFVSFKKLPRKLEFNISYFFTISEAISFLNNKPVEGTSKLQTFNIQTNYKPNSDFYIKNTFKTNYANFLNSKTLFFENNNKVTFKIGQNIYAKINSRTYFGATIPTQPIFNLELERFFFKNKINLECKLINIFNFSTISSVSQSLNQQIASQVNNLPRNVLIKVNFFLEKWI